MARRWIVHSYKRKHMELFHMVARSKVLSTAIVDLVVVYLQDQQRQQQVHEQGVTEIGIAKTCRA